MNKNSSLQLTPVVGYPGGKRRLLTHLRPFFDPEVISTYVEPFVGMGAVYLDLRARGYKGPAIVADSNLSVCDFWSAVHQKDDGAALLEACAELCNWPATEDGFWFMMNEPCVGPSRVARFLWLTNFMYANLPPSYVQGVWKAPRSSGTKLKSAGKWNKTFPWAKCLDRLRLVVSFLQGLPCKVDNDGFRVLTGLVGHETVYADPPYLKRAQYSGNGRYTTDSFIEPVLASRGHIVLSELEEILLPPGWSCHTVNLLSRQAGPFQGAGSSRAEKIYANFVPGATYDVLARCDKGTTSI